MPVVNFARGKQTAVFRTLDVRAVDTAARDYIFEPGLDICPAIQYPLSGIPVLDQGEEGACVGFALATVINVSMMQRSKGQRLHRSERFDLLSARMLHEIAKR